MIVGSRLVTVLRISATGAAAIVASLLFPILSANSQPNWQHRPGHLDHAVARAFKGVKNCVARELESGSYPSNVDDALRVILVRNCGRQYDAFFQACVATGKESEVCLGFVQSWTAAQFKERFYRWTPSRSRRRRSGWDVASSEFYRLSIFGKHPSHSDL